jgi:hypothetical protein
MRSKDHNQLIATQGAVEDFVRLGPTQGSYLDDLIRMAESGMSGQQIAETIVSTDS